MEHKKDIEDNAPFFGLPSGQEPINYPQNFHYGNKDLKHPHLPAHKEHKRNYKE